MIIASRLRDAHVADRAVYHAIGDRVIREVSVTDATAANSAV